MPDTKPPPVTLGSVHTRGDGTRAAASETAQAMTRGIAAGAAQGGALPGGSLDIARLRVRLPPGASAQEISRALERAIARAVRDES
jgi:hypothetical protein